MPAEQPAGDEVAETPAADPANDGLLSQYTRAIAYTHPDATWTCVQGMQYRFDGFAYGVAENDTDWLNEASVAVEAQMTCWDGYEENRLSTLTPPRGAEAAHEALHLWVSLNQNALVQLKEAESAHLNGNAAERDRLFKEGQQVLDAAVKQEQTMLAVMNAITSADPEFLTVAEHQYVAWLNDMMGLSDNCFSELWMVRHLEENDPKWTDFAASCMTELPTTLSEETPPTERMKQLQQDVFSQLAPVAKLFTALAERHKAAPMALEALLAEIEAIDEAWFTLVPTWEKLFVYRTWGE